MEVAPADLSRRTQQPPTSEAGKTAPSEIQELDESPQRLDTIAFPWQLGEQLDLFLDINLAICRSLEVLRGLKDLHSRDIFPNPVLDIDIVNSTLNFAAAYKRNPEEASRVAEEISHLGVYVVAIIDYICKKIGLSMHELGTISYGGDGCVIQLAEGKFSEDFFKELTIVVNKFIAGFNQNPTARDKFLKFKVKTNLPKRQEPKISEHNINGHIPYPNLGTYNPKANSNNEQKANELEETEQGFYYQIHFGKGKEGRNYIKTVSNLLNQLKRTHGSQCSEFEFSFDAEKVTLMIVLNEGSSLTYEQFSGALNRSVEAINQALLDTEIKKYQNKIFEGEISKQTFTPDLTNLDTGQYVIEIGLANYNKELLHTLIINLEKMDKKLRGRNNSRSLNYIQTGEKLKVFIFTNYFNDFYNIFKKLKELNNTLIITNISGYKKDLQDNPPLTVTIQLEGVVTDYVVPLTSTNSSDPKKNTWRVSSGPAAEIYKQILRQRYPDLIPTDANTTSLAI